MCVASRGPAPSANVYITVRQPRAAQGGEKIKSHKKRKTEDRERKRTEGGKKLKRQ
jgi:hypothetical protein